MIVCKVDFEPARILTSRGFGPGKRLQKYFAGRCKLRMDPYTPFQSGVLKNTAAISPDGDRITYTQPYAHYQYIGTVYGPNVLTKKGWRSMAKKGGKKPTDRKIKYHGAPMRGAKWDRRMVADHGGDLAKDVAAFLKAREPK